MSEVQRIGPSTGSQQVDPIAEAGQWKEGLRASFDSARVDGVIKPHLVAQAAYQSMIAPTASGVPLRDLPPDIAQQILDSRNEAMKEFFEGWAESIRKNAEADKKSAFAAMLKQARLRALSQARMFVTGRTPGAPNPSSSNRTPAPNNPNPDARIAAGGATTLASSGVSGAFEQGNRALGGLQMRNNRFG